MTTKVAKRLYVSRYEQGWEVKRVWRWGFTAYWEPEVGKMLGTDARGFKTKAEARAAGQAWLAEQDEAYEAGRREF
jgi:hypothetical protein